MQNDNTIAALPIIFLKFIGSPHPTVFTHLILRRTLRQPLCAAQCFMHHIQNIYK
jgi:hypothetical protein